MDTRQPVSKALAALILGAVALVPATISAQTARGSYQTSYHLVQLSVASGAASAEEFAAQAETIRSCKDAKDLAEDLGADIRRNRFVRQSQLPETLRDTLRDLPTGQATDVFTADGSILRVLVICNRL